MGIRQAVVVKLAPDVHRLAPGANTAAVRRIVQLAVQGAGPLPGAAAAAETLLAEAKGHQERAVRELTLTHTRMAAAQGLVTNLGGLLTLAATIPVNLAGLCLLQCRLVAGVAHLRGYDLDDPRVRDAILLCTLGEDRVRSLVKDGAVPGSPMVLATAPAHDPELVSVLAAEVTAALVGRVVGRHAAVAVVRRLPGAGGVWGGTADGYATFQVGRYAARELKPRSAALQPRRRARR